MAFLPRLPDTALDAELALAFFLPPLRGSACRTDRNAFRRDLRPLFLLAMGSPVPQDAAWGLGGARGWTARGRRRRVARA